MKVKQKNWKQLTTDEKREAVLPLSDLSAGEISKKLPGSTRNSIIGFCHRHKIPFGAAKGLVPERHKSAEQKAEEIKKRYSAKRAREAAAKQADAEAAAAAVAAAAVHRSPPRKRSPPPSVSKDATVLDSEQFISAEEHKIAARAARGPISIMQLTDTTCRWPLNHTYVGVAVSQMMFCGKTTDLVAPYCPECSKKTLRRAHEVVPKKAAEKKSLRLVGIR